MQFKRRFKRKTRKVYRKKGAKSTVNKVTHYKPNPVPDRMFLKLSYSTAVNITAGVGVAAAHVFQSSCQDPDLTGVGHQPLGRDQWATFYQKYRVYGIGYKITFANEAAGSQAEVHIVPKSTSSIITNRDTIWEKPYSKHRVLGVVASGQSIKHIKGYISGAKALGVSTTKFKTDDKTGALMGSDPTTMFFLHLNTNGMMTGDASNVNARVQLTYYMEFYDRIPLTQS